MAIATLLVILIYLRVSTEDQFKHGYSLPEQREKCLAKAAEIAGGREYRTVIIEDVGGGDILERPKLTELREFVRDHKPTHFVCMDPDRFSRETFIQLLVTREIEGVGAQLVFVNHNYENTAEGKLFYTLRGAISQFEKAKILDRTKTGLRRKLKVGQVANGARPYGLDYDKENDTLVVVPDEAVWVEQIFRWRAERIPPMEIRDRLIALGVPTKRGGTWRSSTIQGMLRNTTYIGQMQCLRWNTAGYKQQRQLPKELRKSTPKQRPPEEWTIVRVPAIISEELFQAVQGVLRTNKRQATRGSGLLSGVAICGLCGAPVHYSKEANGRHSLRCYQRSPRRDLISPGARCSLPYVSAARIEEPVWERITEALTNPNELITRLERELRGGAGSGRLAEARRALSELTDALRQLEVQHADTLALVVSGRADKAVGAVLLEQQSARLSTLRRQVDDAQRRISALEAQATVSDSFRRNLIEVKERLQLDNERVRKVLAALPPEKRQHLLRLLVKEVAILPGRRYEIHWNVEDPMPREKHIPSGT